MDVNAYSRLFGALWLATSKTIRSRLPVTFPAPSKISPCYNSANRYASYPIACCFWTTVRLDRTVRFLTAIVPSSDFLSPTITTNALLVELVLESGNMLPVTSVPSCAGNSKTMETTVSMILDTSFAVVNASSFEPLPTMKNAVPYHYRELSLPGSPFPCT